MERLRDREIERSRPRPREGSQEEYLTRRTSVRGRRLRPTTTLKCNQPLRRRLSRGDPGRNNTRDPSVPRPPHEGYPPSTASLANGSRVRQRPRPGVAAVATNRRSRRKGGVWRHAGKEPRSPQTHVAPSAASAEPWTSHSMRRPRGTPPSTGGRPSGRAGGGRR